MPPPLPITPLPHTKGQKKLFGVSYSSEAQWNPTEVFFLFPCLLHPSALMGQDGRAGGTLSCRQKKQKKKNSAPVLTAPPPSLSLHASHTTFISCFKNGDTILSFLCRKNQLRVSHFSCVAEKINKLKFKKSSSLTLGSATPFNKLFNL